MKLNASKFSGLLFLLTAIFFSRPAVSAPRPNIVQFYVDDLGWGSIGPNGQDERRAEGEPSVHTPNIDALAEAGVNFQRGYGCPVCSPARSSVMTGFHQGHTWADRNDTDNAKKAIRADDVTIGDALKNAGYACGYWGKWGFGASSDRVNPEIVNRQSLPTEHGFDHVLAELHHVRAHTFFQPTLWSHLPESTGIQLIDNTLEDYKDNPDYPEEPAFQNDADYPERAYCDDFYLFRALEFVRNRAQQCNADGTPFFASICPQIPHSPYDEISYLPEWAAYYADEPGFGDLSKESQEWAAMVTRIDAHFGNILEALEDPNGDGDTSDSVVANTLVVFQSDNGGAGNNAIGELGSNSNLRGRKGTIWEGGIRVPMVMRWPAMINNDSALQAGTNSQKPIDGSDMLPTFCELAGVETPLGLDGVSIAAYLMGESDGYTREFLIHESQPDHSIIRGDMKLVDNNGNLELYDLADDPTESNNIAGSNQDLVEELAELMYGEGVAEPQWSANTYHTWTGAAGSDASQPENWSAYIYSNQVNGTVYDMDNGPPQSTWIATMFNSGPANSQSFMDNDADFLALGIGGGSNALQTLAVTNCTLTGRNEIRLKPFSRIKLVHGRLASLRQVKLYTNAVLSGSGTIDASLKHSGQLSVTRSDPLAIPDQQADNILTNGGFELGTGQSYDETDQWFNSGPGQNINARNGTNPHQGSWRGIIGNGSNGLVAPAVNTGRIIQSNDTFNLSFFHAGASGWNVNNDTITATLYYNDGSEQVLGSHTVTPAQSFTAGYDDSGDIHVNATDESAGHILHLRFASETAESSGEFGSIDDVSLIVSNETLPDIVIPAKREITVSGDYWADSSAEMEASIAGTATQGVDYAHLKINGDARVAGNLKVALDADYTPSAGDSFEIITAKSISGEFDNPDDLAIGSNGSFFSIDYYSDRVVLSVPPCTAKGTPHTWLEKHDLVEEDDYEAADLADNDKDGYKAWQEFVFGTDPKSVNSAFRSSCEEKDNEIKLSWISAQGRNYRVYRSMSILEDFSDISGTIPANPPRNIWTTQMEHAQAFFRIGAELN